MTSGYMIDPRSSKAVLKALTALIGIEVDTSKLDERAHDMEKVMAKLREMEQMQAAPERLGTEGDLRYIG